DGIRVFHVTGVQTCALPICNSWPGFAYLLVEGMIFRALLSLLTLSPGRFVVGNAVVLDIGDGVYAVLAHLRRGSVRVRKGDRVQIGRASCREGGRRSGVAVV